MSFSDQGLEIVVVDRALSLCRLDFCHSIRLQTFVYLLHARFSGECWFIISPVESAQIEYIN